MSMLCDLEGVGLLDEDGRRFVAGNQVIIQNVDEYDRQVNGDNGVIVSIANVPDGKDHQDYMDVWLYRSHRDVKAFESDVYIIKDHMTYVMMMSIKCCMTLTGG